MTADVEHRQGCPATGGYGHGIEPCICGAVANVELLPLPGSVANWLRRFGAAYGSNQSEVIGGWFHYYARAVAEHNVAAQAAEIEALRTAVAEARDCWHMASGTADLAMKHRDMAEARAERLAEALRHQRWCRTCGEDGWDSCEEGRAAIDLLRDHDQEGGNP